MAKEAKNKNNVGYKDHKGEQVTKDSKQASEGVDMGPYMDLLDLYGDQIGREIPGSSEFMDALYYLVEDVLGDPVNSRSKRILLHILDVTTSEAFGKNAEAWYNDGDYMPEGELEGDEG